MARPTRRTIASGISSWDGDVDANFAILTDTPLPLFQVALVGSLPAAASYENCLALVGSTLYISNGVSWSPYFTEAAFVANSVAATAADMATDFNLLLSSLKTAGIMASS